MQIRAKKYVGKSTLGRRLLGEVLATHPSSSFSSAAEMIAISRAQLLTEAEMMGKKKPVQMAKKVVLMIILQVMTIMIHSVTYQKYSLVSTLI